MNFCPFPNYDEMMFATTSSSLSLLFHFSNRYLILDVLGQGTFGQVVKCQNLQTQEIVGVKVVKNKPAYFNQSMMEVTILELVSFNYVLCNKRARNEDLS